MRRAFSKPTSGADDLARLMSTFRDEGYEGLQLKGGQYAPWLDDADGFLRRFGDDPGRVSALIFFGALDDEGAEHLSKTIGFADRVGSERVIFCHNHPRTGVTRDRLVDFARIVSRFGQDAAELGIAISLHHHYDQPVMHPEDFEVFFGAAEPGSVGLTIDTAHLAKSGIADIPAFIADHAAIIDNIHLKDYDDTGWRLLGEGRLDLAGIIAASAASGFEGWLCVDEESDADLATGFRVSREWLDEHAASDAPR